MRTRVLFAATALLLSTAAVAETPADFLKTYEAAARQATPGFNGFSSQRGEALYNAVPQGDWSCASCHTRNPAQPGRHAKTDKAIAPLAPGANPERFTSAKKVEKWFKRNCNDVIGRECTAQEKGDVLTYLNTIKR